MRKRARFLMKSSLKERVVRFFFFGFPKWKRERKREREREREREGERERGRERACGQMLQLQFERGDVR